MTKAELLFGIITEAITDAEAERIEREIRSKRFSTSKTAFKKGDHVRLLSIQNKPRAYEGETARVLQQRGDRVAIQMDQSGEKGVVPAKDLEKMSDIFIM